MWCQSTNACVHVHPMHMLGPHMFAQLCTHMQERSSLPLLLRISPALLPLPPGLPSLKPTRARGGHLGMHRALATNT